MNRIQITLDLRRARITLPARDASVPGLALHGERDGSTEGHGHRTLDGRT